MSEENRKEDSSLEEIKPVEKKEKTMNHVFVESSEEEVDPVNVISQNI